MDFKIKPHTFKFRTGDTDEKAKSYNNGQGREYQPDMVDNQLLVQFELNF